MSATNSAARRLLALVASGLVVAAPLAAAPAASARAPHTAAKHAHKQAKRHHGAKACPARRQHRRGRRCAGARLASPAPTVRLRSRSTVASDGVISCRAGVGRSSIKRVDFYLDHLKIGTDHVAPYQCRASARRLTAGTHHLRAVAVTKSGRSGSRTIRLRVAGVRAESASAQNDAVAQDRTGWNRGDSWSDSFESDDFRGWSWWGQGQQDIWGHANVVNPRTEGIPSLGGDHVAKFQTTPDDIAHGRINAKLYRGFGSDVGNPDSRPPADVSGVYSAWYYFPSSYKVPDHTWANIFQFKEQYRQGGGTPSDPLWWVQLGPVHWASDMAQGYGDAPISGRSDAPVAFINNYNSNWSVHHSFVPLPLDRWFEIKAVLRQDDRIDFYLDGKLLDTAKNSVYPVSPFHGAASMAWTFGVGNYSTGANGPMYVDRAAYAKL